jgi:hypothetical protein
VTDVVAVALAMKAGLSEDSAEERVVDSLSAQMIEGEMGAQVLFAFKGYDPSLGEVIGWDYKSRKYMIRWTDGSESKQYWLTHEQLCESKLEE